MTSPRETTWWTSACRRPQMAREEANCSAVRTCNPLQRSPPYLGQLLIEIDSVDMLPSARDATLSESALFRNQWKQFLYATNDQSQREVFELISSCNLTQEQSATFKCKNRTEGTT